MKKATKNSGFVLLMVLAVVAIAGTVLAASAYYSSRQAVIAGRSARDIQLKWAEVSCRAVCLENVEEILQAAAEEADEPVASVEKNIELGDLKLRLIISDEQAKANVNMLAGLHDIQSVQQSLVKLQSGMREILPVKLKPLKVNKPAQDELPRNYSSFDQVFDYGHPAELVIREQNSPCPVERVTCWGSGKLNFKKADECCLDVISAGVLSETDRLKLLSFRKESPQGNLDEAIKYLELNKEQAESLKQILTDKSDCYSLWVIADGQTRSWYRLYIRESEDADEGEGKDTEEDSAKEDSENTRLWSYRW